MKIIVCLKEVPDMETHFRLNSTQTAIDREGIVFPLLRSSGRRNSLLAGAVLHPDKAYGWDAR